VSIFGENIRNLLLISSHTSHLDSSFALQNIQAGQPLVTIFFVLKSVSTYGCSISHASCDSVVLIISQTSGCGDSRKRRVLPLRLIRYFASLYN
jgi:hypothetical protein